VAGRLAAPKTTKRRSRNLERFAGSELDGFAQTIIGAKQSRQGQAKLLCTNDQLTILSRKVSTNFWRRLR
jgi:hypothetical protein